MKSSWPNTFNLLSAASGRWWKFVAFLLVIFKPDSAKFVTVYVTEPRIFYYRTENSKLNEKIEDQERRAAREKSGSFEDRAEGENIAKRRAHIHTDTECILSEPSAGPYTYVIICSDTGEEKGRGKKKRRAKERKKKRLTSLITFLIFRYYDLLIAFPLSNLLLDLLSSRKYPSCPEVMFETCALFLYTRILFSHFGRCTFSQYANYISLEIVLDRSSFTTNAHGHTNT